MDVISVVVCVVLKPGAARYVLTHPSFAHSMLWRQHPPPMVRLQGVVWLLQRGGSSGLATHLELGQQQNTPEGEKLLFLQVMPMGQHMFWVFC